MDWKERALATEDRLRSQFLDGLSGDARAYREFLSALASHLRGYYRKRLTRLPDDVEDLVQECLLAIHSNRHTYHPEQPLTAWVHSIARYKMVDLLRARSRREDRNEPLDEALEILGSSAEQAAEARRDLDQLMQTLPERQRRAMWMVKIEGASVADTAAATGMSEASVKVNVHRSLKLLAAKIRGQA